MRPRCSPYQPALAAAAGLLGLLSALPQASAGAALKTASGQAALQEAQFELDIHFDGVVASVESQQVIVNPGKFPEQAVYTFDLPVDAAITGVSIRLADGRTSTAALVDATAALAPVTDPDGVTATPDPGMLRLIARDVPEIHGSASAAMATYELRVYPVSPGKAVTVTTRWVVPLRYDDGRLSLRIPARGEAGNLVREWVDLRVTPPAGVAGLGLVHGGDKALGTGTRTARFMAPPRGDLVMDAALNFGAGARQPVVAFATTPIGEDLGALGLAVLAPPPAGKSALDYERIVLVVDVSRSLGSGGLAAAANLTDAILGGAPANTEVEAILFDRTARRLLGAFRPNDREIRKTLAHALRPGELVNGSDLGEALDAVRALLQKNALALRPGEGFERGNRAATLVVFLSDGMVPLELTPRLAAERLGSELLREIEVLSVILVPDEAPVPDTREGVLPALASRASGRTVAVRFGESEARAKSLAAELARPAPLTEVSLQLGSALADKIELPRTIEPGRGLIAAGLYRGPAPKSVALVAQHQGRAVQIAARRDPALSRAGLALTLAVTRQEDFLRERESTGSNRSPAAVEDSAALEEARRLLVATARRVLTVTPYTTLVALDAQDRFARDRLALSKTWGPAAFFRLPPPPERMPGHSLVRFAWRALPGTGASSEPRAPRRTGQLDRTTVARLMEQHVIPRARACYEADLRRQPSLSGSLVVILELARGEVQHAAVEHSTFPGTNMESCVTEAAYGIQVPRVKLGDDPESIDVVRYPLSFRKNPRGGDVQTDESPTKPSELRNLLGGDAPLDGIE